MLKVEIIKTASLGNRGYIVHDGVKAIAIDVQRDYDRWKLQRSMPQGTYQTI